MREIANYPDTGLRVVSTFSGCGGSCLGFRMAGFRVLYASEFVKEARDAYRANNPDTPVDPRDIRSVTATQILQVTGLDVGELDAFEGSPPCASFSTAGKRTKHWGQKKVYSSREQRTDDLFFEYIRLIDGLRPKTFVAENVKGLVVGKSKGYFKIIMRKMKALGYDVQARVLDASYLGVPQARERLIIVGVRDDVAEARGRYEYPKPLPYRYSIRESFHGEERLEPVPYLCYYAHYAVGRAWDQTPYGRPHPKHFNMRRADLDKPSPTITQTTGTRRDGGIGAYHVAHGKERRSFSIAELKRICAFPDDFRLPGTYAQNVERLGRSVPPRMMRAVAENIKTLLLDGEPD